MKRILCLIDSLGAGGAQRQLVGLAVALKECGYEVDVALYHNDLFYAAYLKEAQVPFTLIKGADSKFQRFWRIAQFISQSSPDVVISYLDTPSICACIAKLFNRSFKLIVSDRNTTQVVSKRERLKFLLFRLADVIVPNSFTQGNFITQNYPHLAKKVSVITNFIDNKSFAPVERQIHNSVPQIISVGRMAVQKNYLNMVEAVNILVRRNVKAHFNWYANTFADAYMAQVMEKIHTYQLEDIISIFEPVGDIANRYCASDVFWLASKYEGFPNVLCEAMACGLPVACSNVCDNPYIVKDGENGFLLNPDSAEDMADKLEDLLKMSAQQREQMSSNNILRIQELCSITQFIRHYKSIIDN